MVRHGDAPKIVFVKRYARWQRGHRRYVDSHMRGFTPEPFFRDTLLQLDFGF